MEIYKAVKGDAGLIARLVGESNKDVATKFGLNIKNNPKHPSFYTADWARSDFERGEEYFIAQQNGEPMGCVAYESPNDSLSYLNRLSVLPKYRRKGIGEMLVRKVIEYSNQHGKETVSIGIIAKYTELKNWYIKLGFVEGETRVFKHLPFAVMYLSYKIKR
jgi:ribosomal protein S18 acetylase RimI-like enzyme